MSRKKGTVIPKTGNILAAADSIPATHSDYATMIASALRKELGGTHLATKTVMLWTGASERAVKHWFSGRSGPCGDHFVILAQNSDEVLSRFLSLADRPQAVLNINLSRVRGKLVELLQLLGTGDISE